MKSIRKRFKILEYQNRSGSTSYRVTGLTRMGERIRENYADEKTAHYRETQLEAEYHAAPGSGGAMLRTTRLTDEELKVCEAVLNRLESVTDLETAVDYWKRTGKPASVETSPRLDEALQSYLAHLEVSKLREITKTVKISVLRRFANSTQNMRVVDFQPVHIKAHVNGIKSSPASRDAVRKVISAFFSYCMEADRMWIANNPCFAVTVDGLTPEYEKVPVVLSVKDCVRLMRTAETLHEGKMVPYFALGLFAGLRPTEATKLDWEQINLDDNEIKLLATQTKTRRQRKIMITEPLRSWLEKYKGEGKIYHSTPMSREIRKQAGLMSKDHPMVPDLLRHTAISHWFRHTGSYGETAYRHGNSEGVIKRFYDGAVSSKETEAFFSIRPTGTPANVVTMPNQKVA